MWKEIGSGEEPHLGLLLEALCMVEWQRRTRAANLEVVGVLTWRTAGIKAVGRDASSVAGLLLRGVLSAVQWFAKVATKSIWRKGAVCRISGFAPSVERHDAPVLATDVVLHFAIGILNMTARPRDQANEVSAARRVWVSSVVNWSTDSPNRSRWGGRNRRCAFALTPQEIGTGDRRFGGALLQQMRNRGG